MICRFCPAGRRIKWGDHRCVSCIPYGMILKEEHECKREGWKEYAGYVDNSEEFGPEAELPENGRGVIEILPGILQGPGE